MQWDGADGAADFSLTLHAVFRGQIVIAQEPATEPTRDLWPPKI